MARISNSFYRHQYTDYAGLGIVQSIYENYWHNLKQIATEFFSAGMHSGEVSLKHTKKNSAPFVGKAGQICNQSDLFPLILLALFGYQF